MVNFFFVVAFVSLLVDGMRKNGPKLFERFPSRDFGHQAALNCLQAWKRDNFILRFDSAKTDISSVDPAALQFYSKRFFSSATYFDDTLFGSAKKQYKNIESSNSLLFAQVVVSSVFSSVVLPQMVMENQIKNWIGIASLLAPFGLLIWNFLAQDSRLIVESEEAKELSNKERICYHEAGHFLVGYLCGIPASGYNVTTASNLAVEVVEGQQPPEKLIGSLLILSMGGVVAETLRFGDAEGGSEDVALAMEVIRTSPLLQGEPADGYLRWAVLNALKLLTQHRDILDNLASAMSESKSVAACYEEIEFGGNCG